MKYYLTNAAPKILVLVFFTLAVTACSTVAPASSSTSLADLPKHKTL